MTQEVSVALIGDPARMREDVIPQEELERPYAERESVALEVTEDQTMGAILTEAARQLGVPGWGDQPYEPTYVGFYRPEDDTETPPLYASMLPLVDMEGRARFTWSIREVTYGEVLAAAEAGVIYGDPTRLHFALVPPIGNGVLPDWTLVCHAYEILQQVFQIAAAPGGAAATWQLIRNRQRKRAEKATEAIRRHASSWAERGGDPHLFDLWLGGRAWQPAGLARMLDCSVDEAEAVLWAFGFDQAPDGTWRRRVTEEAKFMDDNRRHIVISTGLPYASDKQLREEFERRTTTLLETERAPPPPDWQQLEWLKPDAFPAHLPGNVLLPARLWIGIRRQLQRFRR